HSNISSSYPNYARFLLRSTMWFLPLFRYGEPFTSWLKPRVIWHDNIKRIPKLPDGITKIDVPLGTELDDGINHFIGSAEDHDDDSFEPTDYHNALENVLEDQDIGTLISEQEKTKLRNELDELIDSREQDRQTRKDNLDVEAKGYNNWWKTVMEDRNWAWLKTNDESPRTLNIPNLRFIWDNKGENLLKFESFSEEDRLFILDKTKDIFHLPALNNHFLFRKIISLRQGGSLNRSDDLVRALKNALWLKENNAMKGVSEPNQNIIFEYTLDTDISTMNANGLKNLPFFLKFRNIIPLEKHEHLKNWMMGLEGRDYSKIGDWFYDKNTQWSALSMLPSEYHNPGTQQLQKNSDIQAKMREYTAKLEQVFNNAYWIQTHGFEEIFDKKGLRDFFVVSADINLEETDLDNIPTCEVGEISKVKAQPPQEGWANPVEQTKYLARDKNLSPYDMAAQTPELYASHRKVISDVSFADLPETISSLLCNYKHSTVNAHDLRSKGERNGATDFLKDSSKKAFDRSESMDKDSADKITRSVSDEILISLEVINAIRSGAEIQIPQTQQKKVANAILEGKIVRPLRNGDKSPSFVSDEEVYLNRQELTTYFLYLLGEKVIKKLLDNKEFRQTELDMIGAATGKVAKDAEKVDMNSMQDKAEITCWDKNLLFLLREPVMTGFRVLAEKMANTICDKDK
ncbi:hypothetical protein K9M41_00565, partial [Candidatus Gracilibacteria bacterium]|nr:hypothetical protein [Candidatus Gracilibacteria bacterium]